jgi:hypothetical protein
MTSSAVQLPRAIAAGLLEGEENHGKREVRRFAAGSVLAATYGLSLGARFGVSAMAAHAAGVPLAFLAVALVGGPAFYVALAHAGVDISPQVLTASLARGVAVAGLILAGLAPTMLLLGLSCDSDVSVACYGVLGLAVGGGMGLRAMFGELERHRCGSGFSGRLPRFAFAFFACVFCSRIWWSVLPILGGRS